MATLPNEAKDARGRGRELALGVLCSVEDEPDADVTEALQRIGDRLLSDPPFGDADGEDAFAELARDAEVNGLAAEYLRLYAVHRERVDTLIRDTSKRWRMERMDQVDRNVIRLAAAELCGDGAPTAVVLAEAVRIASRYGSERSAKFVNGVAQALATRVREE